MHTLLLSLIFMLLPSVCLFSDDKFILKIRKDIPEWMDAQISEDLSYFANKPISLKKLNDLFENRSLELYLVKFIIANNKVKIEKKFPHPWVDSRIEVIKGALNRLCKSVSLPNLVFLMSLHDGLHFDEDVPLFVMAKKKGSIKLIMVPDFEALQGKYQVLKNQDITKYFIEWNSKKPQLIWRGSTAQHDLDESTICINEKNMHLYSRVLLCEMSKEYPSLLDAKFTVYAQGGETIPYLQGFKGTWISFEEQLKYKYHIFIDGNASPYSASGWKFFTNSLIFKPDSSWIQWYYNALEPYVHYVPIKKDLADLVEKILWAQEHDKTARTIAGNARRFAKTHITVDDNLAYFYFALKKYSQLTFAID